MRWLVLGCFASVVLGFTDIVKDTTQPVTDSAKTAATEQARAAGSEVGKTGEATGQGMTESAQAEGDTFEGKANKIADDTKADAEEKDGGTSSSASSAGASNVKPDESEKTVAPSNPGNAEEAFKNQPAAPPMTASTKSEEGSAVAQDAMTGNGEKANPPGSNIGEAGPTVEVSPTAGEDTVNAVWGGDLTGSVKRSGNRQTEVDQETVKADMDEAGADIVASVDKANAQGEAAGTDAHSKATEIGGVDSHSSNAGNGHMDNSEAVMTENSAKGEETLADGQAQVSGTAAGITAAGNTASQSVNEGGTQFGESVQSETDKYNDASSSSDTPGTPSENRSGEGKAPTPSAMEKKKKTKTKTNNSKTLLILT